MSSFWNWAIPIGMAAVGGVMSSNANKTAAQITADATNRATDAQLQGIQDATAILQQQQAAASPGLTAMQGMITAGNTLTPAQRTALNDARTTALNQLSNSGLRGSARATSAVVRDVEGRMRDQYLDANQRRSDTAAQTLSGQYFNAGNNIANMNVSQGNAISQGLTTIGNSNANMTTSNANIQGKALGDIGAIIADELKDQNRGTSYKQPTQQGMI